MTDELTPPAPEQDDSFAKALAENLEVYSPKTGDRVKGKIISITDELVIVECGAKSEAVMDPRDLEGQQIGDEIEGFVIETEPTLTLTTRLTDKKLSSPQLKSAFDAGLPVTGKITEVVNGGFSVDIGGVRAFLPMGHLDTAHIEDAEAFIGKSFEFKILEYDPGEQKFVISRKEILQKETAKEAEKLWESLEEGAAVDGKVTSLQSFGAFVDIGGLEGLVHVSEISDEYITSPSEVLKVGQDVRTKILKVDKAKNRISLSMRAVDAVDWDTIFSQLVVGATFSGTVSRKTDFGIFVQLQPGVEGLLHISQLKPDADINHPDYETGKEISGWIRSLNAERKRIGLTLKELPPNDPWAEIGDAFSENDVVDGKVEEMTSFGIFVEITPGLTGLMPFSELRKMDYKKPKKIFKPGSTHRFKIISLDPSKRRLTLIPSEPYQEKPKAKPASEAAKKRPKKHAAKSSPKAPSGASARTPFGQALAAALRKKGRA